MVQERLEIHGQDGSSFPFGGAGAIAVVAVLIFLACLLGIYTRPIGLLATFWPANALMLGLMIRIPRMRTVACWAAAFGAYVLADIVTGSDIVKALTLNLANLASVGGALAFFRRMPMRVVELRELSSIRHLIFGSVSGAFAGGICGMVANPILFGGSVAGGFWFWFATELVNYIAVLPLMLSAPSRIPEAINLRRISRRNVEPLLALCLSCGLSLFIGGPESIVFVIPALLWCGMSYSVFLTSVLSMACSILTLSQLATSYLSVAEQMPDSFVIISYRLGVTFVALCPIMLAVNSASRRSALSVLSDQANRDFLTGLPNRRVFLDRAGALIAQDVKPAMVIMLDIDHFKRINDTFGHASGDKVLGEFVKRVEGCLRASDLFGRLGGEEFGIVLPHCNLRQGSTIATRIRKTVCKDMVKLDDGRSLRVTVSLGVVPKLPGNTFEELMKIADSALYEAKKTGRNRVMIFGRRSEDGQ